MRFQVSSNTTTSIPLTTNERIPVEEQDLDFGRNGMSWQASVPETNSDADVLH